MHVPYTRPGSNAKEARWSGEEKNLRRAARSWARLGLLEKAPPRAVVSSLREGGREGGRGERGGRNRINSDVEDDGREGGREGGRESGLT